MHNEVYLGYLGPEGTFSEQAALKLGKGDKRFKCTAFPTIPHVLKAVEKGYVNLGIVPVENSIEGTVNITLDMLAHEVNLFVQGEIILDIKHCLAVKDGCSVDSVHTIYSHYQALAQCRRFLLKKFPRADYKTVGSTAEAAVMVKEGEGMAAITSREAANKYKLVICCADASDYPNNQTRFFAVGQQCRSLWKPEKTSLCISLLENKPGALYEILEEFYKEQINLTKIESRPSKEELGNYIFFFDCQADLLKEKCSVINNLKVKCKDIKIIGSYGTFKEDN